MVDFTSRYPRSSYSNGASFSSSLLDAIYRSIDQEEDEVVIYRESTRMEKSYRSNTGAADEEMADFRRAKMIEKWMEEKVTEKVVVQRKSTPDLPAGISRKDLDSFSLSSSDSGIAGGGGLCSSFESESFPVQRPKPVRTAVPETVGELLEFSRRGYGDGDAERTPKRDGGLLKTKSRALKLYADLKKVKQPISPGGKLAGLLNSLFAGGNSKKTKISDLDTPSLKSSTCSSASSFSRSCLSKTPSSRGKSEKRSVRFSPVSVIFNDDDFRSNKTQPSNLKLNHGVEEMVREIVEKYHRKKESAEFPMDHLRNWEEDDDDAGSCGSSDLFELDNLPKWGMEELPVYETTNLPNPNWLH